MKITALRKKVGQLSTLINCKNTGNFTNHQKEIKQKFFNKYGKTRIQALQFKLTLLKQDLKATSIKLKRLKKNHLRQVIDSKFSSNTKSVYPDFKGSSITVNETPTKNEVEEFWKSIWEKETKFIKNVKWLKELEKTYCKDLTPKTYKIDRQNEDKVINNMPLNKSPGKNLIRTFWFKKFHFTEATY